MSEYLVFSCAVTFYGLNKECQERSFGEYIQYVECKWDDSSDLGGLCFVWETILSGNREHVETGIMEGYSISGVTENLYNNFIVLQNEI